MWAIVIEAAAGASEGKSGLPQLNTPDFAPQLIWLALSFVILYFLLSRVALPRIGEVIEERRNRIGRDIETAGKLKQETEAALAAYEQALAAARGRAHGIGRETRDVLAAEADLERKRAETGMAAKQASAEARIEAAKSRALASVSSIAAETAAAIVAKLLGEGASRDEIEAAMRPAAAAE
jgi:F-type H+-transporting ATPase subunit b